jgi:hypothetical protein
MSKITWAFLIIVALGILTATRASNAPALELDSCHDDLDRLRKTASEASDSSEDAKSKQDEFEDCRRDPEFYDLMHDGCRSRKSDYQSALSDLESKMDDLDSRLRPVQDSCGYEFSINKMSSIEAAQRRQAAAQRRLCVSYRGFLDLGLTPENVFQMCRTNMDAQWCKACLSQR